MLTPGEPEERTRRQRLAEGIPLPDDTWAAIVAAAREVGVDERRIQQAGAAEPSRTSRLPHPVLSPGSIVPLLRRTLTLDTGRNLSTDHDPPYALQIAILL